MTWVCSLAVFDSTAVSRVSPVVCAVPCQPCQVWQPCHLCHVKRVTPVIWPCHVNCIVKFALSALLSDTVFCSSMSSSHRVSKMPPVYIYFNECIPGLSLSAAAASAGPVTAGRRAAGGRTGSYDFSHASRVAFAAVRAAEA